MITNSPQSDTSQYMRSAAALGVVGSAFYTGIELNRQRIMKSSPTELKPLENDILINMKPHIEEFEKNKGAKGVIDKIFNFFDKQVLKIKEDKLAKLSANSYAGKALMHQAASGFVVWGLISLALSAAVGLFRKKEQS